MKHTPAYINEMSMLVKDDVTQHKEEGYRVSHLEKALQALPKEPTEEKLEQVMALWKKIEKLTPPTNFKYQEPISLEDIRRERQEGPRRVPVKHSPDALRNKALGAWIGRCCGCLLGKPIEGWRKPAIVELLRRREEYPLDNYWPVPYEHEDPKPRYYPGNPIEWLRDHIEIAPRDDDTDYTTINTLIMESKGFDFTSDHVAWWWVNRFPFARVYTAENVAYRNLVNGMPPHQSAVYRNPYREWIGAQIRADAFGYAAPGNMELAAELAYRDASVSHIKNGAYGEMFMAAMIAAAYVTDDLHQAIDYALAEIPKNSRLAEAVRDTVTWCGRDRDWEKTWDRIDKKYGHYSVVHTINNAAIVLLGLLHGKKDFSKTISIAVMGGYDTDCNGATAGSILGTMLGAEVLPKRWFEQFHDTLGTSIVDMNTVKISDMAEKSTQLALKSLER